MGVFPVFKALKKQLMECSGLTETHQQLYASEKLENFRWVSKLVATYSKYKVSEEDLVCEDLCQWLREVGQFAESVYAAPPLGLLLQKFISLNKPGFPLEDYYALSPEPYRTAALPFPSSPSDTCSLPREKYFLTSSGVQLLRSIKGQVAGLPAAIFFRWIHEHGCPSLSCQENVDPKARIRCSCSQRRQQIIVSICGTSSLQQAIQDLRAIRRPYPGVHGAATVHTGFWDLYQGMKSELMEGIDQGLRLSPFEEKEAECLKSTNGSSILRELIVTGHSMGGVIAHLLCLDLLSSTLDFPQSTQPQYSIVLPGSTGPSLVETTNHDAESFLQHSRLKCLEIVTFGEPRSGNQALVDHWVALKKRHQDEYGIPIREYCVKAYNDGVVSLPLIKFGYRHFSQEPLYTVNEKVYRVPSDERECALFHVSSLHPSGSSPSTFQVEPGSDNAGMDTFSLRDTSYPAVNPFSKSSIPLFPLGGHNYYNERDLEGGFLRRMEWLERSCLDKEGWEERYRKEWEEWSRKRNRQRQSGAES